jgi:Domain of unknown function (DUF397)
VSVKPAWAKSSRSVANGACVEARSDEGRVLLRDSKQNGRGPVLSFDPADWAAFIGRVKAS